MTQSGKNDPAPKTSRRSFLTAGAAASFSFMIVPRHVLGGAG